MRAANKAADLSCTMPADRDPKPCLFSSQRSKAVSKAGDRGEMSQTGLKQPGGTKCSLWRAKQSQHREILCATPRSALSPLPRSSLRLRPAALCSAAHAARARLRASQHGPAASAYS
eukprot:2920195-Pleurochrysis_carterae.AAC.4